jgi:hypothetical protein
MNRSFFEGGLIQTHWKPTRSFPVPSFPRRRESSRRWFGERTMDSRLRGNVDSRVGGNDGVFCGRCVTLDGNKERSPIELAP